MSERFLFVSLVSFSEDLAEWLNTLYPELMINVDNFMDRLDTGVALCKVSLFSGLLSLNEFREMSKATNF